MEHILLVSQVLVFTLLVCYPEILTALDIRGSSDLMH